MEKTKKSSTKASNNEAKGVMSLNKLKQKMNKALQWIKAHRKEILAAGLSISALILTVFACKNAKELASFMELLKLKIENPKIDIPNLENLTDENVTEINKIINRASHEVSQHIRNLSKGRHASPEKTKEALDMGIQLLPWQTIVDAYTTGTKTA